MSAEQQLVCPVCGRPRADAALPELDCPACGFQNAYVRLFAGGKSRARWQSAVQAARVAALRAKRLALATAHRFALGSGSAAFLQDAPQRLLIAHGDGRVQIEEQAVAYSSCENNYAVAYAGGTVRVFGVDDSLGQKNTAQWSGVRGVLTAPDCTYGVTADGRVLAAGAPVDASVLSWTNVRRLVCGPDHVAGLREDGRVLTAGHVQAASEIALWENVADIAAARGCIVAMHRDGTVSFAGKAGDARAACAAWTGIAAVAADNAYVYGLTEDGDVLTAGACKPFLDKGRSGAANWHGVAALASNPSGVAALGATGELTLAGTVSGDSRKLLDAWEQHVRPAAFA